MIAEACSDSAGREVISLPHPLLPRSRAEPVLRPAVTALVMAAVADLPRLLKDAVRRRSDKVTAAMLLDETARGQAAANARERAPKSG